MTPTCTGRSGSRRARSARRSRLFGSRVTLRRRRVLLGRRLADGTDQGLDRLGADDAVAAREEIDSMCERLLTNPLIESYTIEFDGAELEDT